MTGGTAAVPTHAGLHGVRVRGPRGAAFSFVSFLCLSLFDFLGALLFFLGQAWAEGKGALASGRHCADSGHEKDWS